jgi:hypothetical protein
MLQLEEKSQVMDIGVQRFFSKFEVLHKKGLPRLLVLNDKLITLSDYKQKMSKVEKDSSKFAGIKGRITGKSFLETPQLDLSIQHEIKHIFITKPTFSKYTEMYEIHRKYSIFPSQVKRGGNIYAYCLSRDNFGVIVSMEQPTKFKEMIHQPVPPNNTRDLSKSTNPYILYLDI